MGGGRATSLGKMERLMVCSFNFLPEMFLYSMSIFGELPPSCALVASLACCVRGVDGMKDSNFSYLLSAASDISTSEACCLFPVTF